MAERHAILAAVPADPTAAIRAADLELDGLRRRQADLENGRGSYANRPLNRAVIAHDEATRNVTRLQGNLTRGRLPRPERREKEAELVQWRLRLAGRPRRPTICRRRSSGASMGLRRMSRAGSPP
jgi:hypothetical protein